MEHLMVSLEIPSRQAIPHHVNHSRTLPIEVDIERKVEDTMPFTPEKYAQRVYLHWKSSMATSLYAGGDFTSLAEFLRSPLLKKSNSTVTVPPNPFAYFYKLDPKCDLAATRLKWLQTEEEIQPGTNHLLFLTGYPCAEWLNKLGSYYGIDPEFYHRHMGFLRPKLFPSVEVAGHSPSLMLPSSTSTIFQLTYVSVGMEENRSHIGLATIQKETDEHMQQYLRELKNGVQWQAGDSVVRSCCVHGQNNFSIEQKLTVYAEKQRLDRAHWILIVWLDSGRTLAKSPSGPWSALNGEAHRHYFYPNCMYKPGIALEEHRVVDRSEDLNLEPLEQSVRLLPKFYGRSLETEEMSSDPFYALNEVFAFVLSSELMFLRAISSDLDVDFEEAEEKLGQGCCTLTLMRYQQLLERHSHRTEETLHFIENRHILGWNKGPLGPKAVEAEAKLKLDFEYLLREGRRLKQRCNAQIAYRNNQNSNAPLAKSKEISSEYYNCTSLIVSGGVFIALISLSLRYYGLQRYL